MKLFFDITQHSLVDAYGQTLKTTPSLFYEEQATFEIAFVSGSKSNPETNETELIPYDLSAFTAWRAAMDHDYDDQTPPMIAVPSEKITVVQDAPYAFVCVEMDTFTEEFKAALNQGESTPATFNLYGYKDGSARTSWVISFTVNCKNIIATTAGTPPPTPAKVYLEDLPETTPDGEYMRRIVNGMSSWIKGAISVTWGSITGKPATFPPSTHNQDWGTITGKPATYSPSAHTQALSTISGLQTALDEKINTAAKGVANGVCDLDSEGRVAWDRIPAHLHNIGEIRQAPNPTSAGEALTFDGDRFGRIAVIESSAKGVANGVASLDANAKIPMSQIPSGIGGGLFNINQPDSPVNAIYTGNGLVAEEDSGKNVLTLAIGEGLHTQKVENPFGGLDVDGLAVDPDYIASLVNTKTAAELIDLGDVSSFTSPENNKSYVITSEVSHLEINPDINASPRTYMLCLNIPNGSNNAISFNSIHWTTGGGELTYTPPELETGYTYLFVFSNPGASFGTLGTLIGKKVLVS